MKNLEALINLSSHMRILYAEDDLDLRETTASILRDLRFNVEECDNGKVAFEAYQQNPFAYDIVITDLNMPFMNGIELLKNIHLQNPDQAVMVVSAHNETEYFLESIRNNITGYILKPIDFEQLIDTLYKTAEMVNVRKENEVYKTKLQEMVEEKTVALERSYEKMHEFLTIDKVTKLQNATMLYHYLDALPKGQKICAILYNIDDLSTINQTYGFELGDSVLAKVGEFLHYNLPEEVNLFKYNSDEFVILCDKLLIDPLSLATQIQAFFKETPVAEGNEHPIYVTLSCGIASSNEPTMLLPNARTALKEARLTGLPNQINTYNAECVSTQKIFMETTWIQKFRSALEEDRVIPLFHPIVDNKTQEIVSYECLARIEEEGAFISPAYFLEAARRSGLMSNLTRTMVNKCFKIFSGKEILFSINITNEDLFNPSFIEFLKLKQEQNGIDPSRVVLEILEDIILNDANSIALKSLEKFKELGYKLALDDFGSDRSNFNRFEQCGVDFVKIDGQFIKDIEHSERNQNIVESIVFMAHKMHIKVIAEFVSTKEEFETVCSLGVDYSQGYFFTQPQKLN